MPDFECLCHEGDRAERCESTVNSFLTDERHRLDTDAQRIAQGQVAASGDEIDRSSRKTLILTLEVLDTLVKECFCTLEPEELDRQLTPLRTT